jgi:hypothetical protein
MLWPATVRASLDPQTNEPYQLTFVFHFSDHPLLSAAFKEAIQREVRDSFQAALGNMAIVDVLDEPRLVEHVSHATGARQAALQQTLTLLANVKNSGLQRALDSWHEISGAKTHFVLIDFHNDHYAISTRQYDGLTGLGSPAVRHAAIYDRQFVARAAELLVERDFGVVGTLGPRQGDQIEVALKGSALTTSMEPWVKKGDVFAVSQIQQDRQGQRGERMEWTLLQASTPVQNGHFRCALLHLYLDALPERPPILGYRCIKLGTGESPLALRLVDDKTRNPIPSVRVRVSQTSFTASDQEQRVTNSEGLMRTQKPYHHIAYASASIGDRDLPIPIAIIDDRTVTCPISVSPEAERAGQWRGRRDLLLGGIYETIYTSAGLFQLLQELNQKKAHDEALDKARSGAKELDRDIHRFESELAALRKDMPGPDAKVQIASCEEGVQRLQGDKERLQSYTDKLQHVLEEKRNPERKKLQEMALSAQLHEQDADYDQAIAAYEEIVTKGGDQPAFKEYEEHLRQLKKVWALKDQSHAKARVFIYSIWPKLTSAAELKQQVAEAQNALKKCIESGDWLTPQRLLKANTDHAKRLADRLKEITSSGSTEEQAEGRTILEIKTDLEKLTKDAADFVRSAKAAAK